MIFRRQERGRSSMRLGDRPRQDAGPNHNSMTARPRVEALDARNGALAQRICRLMKNGRETPPSRCAPEALLPSEAVAAMHRMVYQCAPGRNHFRRREPPKTVMTMPRPFGFAVLIAALGAVFAPAAHATVEYPLSITVLALTPTASSTHAHAAPGATAATHHRSHGRSAHTTHLHGHNAHARHTAEYHATTRSALAHSSTSPLPAGSVPGSSHSHHGHRAATVPHVTHRVNNPTRSFKTGPTTAGAVTQGALLSLDVHALERRQASARPESPESPDKSGRGPPRGGPLGSLVSFPPESPPALVASRRLSIASASSQTPRTSARLRVIAAPRFGADDAVMATDVPQPRLSMGRLHARRVEGPAACIALPSRGGFTCFA